MNRATRLTESSEEVQETFAVARAAIAGLEVNGGELNNLSDNDIDSIREMLELRRELGWED